MPSLDESVQSIDDKLAAIREHVAILERARNALVTPAPSADQHTRRRSQRRRTSARSPTVARTVTPERLTELLQREDAISVAAHAELAGEPASSVQLILREMEASVKVRPTGQRRRTRWHAIRQRSGHGRQACRRAHGAIRAVAHLTHPLASRE